MTIFKSAIVAAVSVCSLLPCQATDKTYGPDYGDFAGLECVESPYDKDIDKSLKDAQEEQDRTNYIKEHGIMKLDIYDAIQTLTNLYNG